MRFGKWCGVAMILAALTLSRVGAAPVPGGQPSPELVAKLIGQLEATDASSRQQAGDKLEELGGPVLPALRQAMVAKTEAEVKRRLELVVTRIENNLLKAEEKRWKDLDAPRRGLKDRLAAVVAKTPALSDQQRASAVYLLVAGRAPTDDEMKLTLKQFDEANGRAAGTLSLARSLVQGKKFCAEVADANVRLNKVRTDLAGEKDMAKQLHLLNSDEFQKVNSAVSGSLSKVMKADEPLIDVAFLLVVSRFPTAKERDQALAHLKKGGRQQATEDIFWSLVNSKEFLRPQ
jgi:hypothetical protein